MKVHLIFDGNATAYRANIVTDMHTKEGLRTSAIVGTLNIIHSTIEMLKKQYDYDTVHVTFVWDGGHSPRRDQLYPDYKIKRKQNWTPEDEEWHKELYQQIDVLHESMSLFGIRSYRKYRWEGDDLVWGVTKEYTSLYPDNTCVIISTDEDFHQLIDTNVQVFAPIKQILYTYENYKELAGIDPETFLFYKILKGDSSDCISGIPGIGEVTAKSLVNKYHTLDNLFEHKDELAQSKRLSRIYTPEGLQILDRNNKLINLKEYVDLSEVQQDIHNLFISPVKVDYGAVRKFFIKYQVVSLLMKLKDWLREFDNLNTTE